MKSQGQGPKPFKRSLVWIRRDLRLQDHTALAAAQAASEEVVLVFNFDPAILDPLERTDRRVSLITQALNALHVELKKNGSALVLSHGDPVSEIPRLAKKIDAEALYFNRDYEPDAKRRDEAVREKLEEARIQVFDFKDHVVFEGSEVLKPDRTPYKVFTPYKRAWLKRLEESEEALQEDSRQTNTSRFVPEKTLTRALEGFLLGNDLGSLVFSTLRFVEQTFDFEFTEASARLRLKRFLKNVSSYHKTRDFPAQTGGTSGLSIDLRFGTLSIRLLFREALKHRDLGAKTWVSELIWREFFQMILDRFPHVKDKAFRPEYQNIRWPGKPEHFKAWKEGRTGFPLIDAAMVHFKKTGQMHNRLRMVVASFLVKDLLIDWREGEAYFARQLLDYDLAANNGGWQWCASTGCDAQPYFRIFNPDSQAKRFDPTGEFVRSVFPKGYTAEPIVDHALQRQKAIELFRNSRR